MGMSSDRHQRTGALAHAQSVRPAAEKKSLTAWEQSRPETERARRRFQTQLSRVPAKDLVFVDESGACTDLTRRYGRAPQGERVREAVPHGRWKVLTILGALSTKGVQASMTVEAATDADVFSTFVQQVLVPTLRPGQVVIMDNLSAHKQRKVRRLLAARRKGVDPAWVEQRICERVAARKAKDFAKADAIRAEVAAKGVELRDAASGTDWRVLL